MEGSDSTGTRDPGKIASGETAGERDDVESDEGRAYTAGIYELSVGSSSDNLVKSSVVEYPKWGISKLWKKISDAVNA